MFRYFIVLFFLTSACSIYDFSDSKDRIDDILNGEDPNVVNITLISPSIESTLYTDSIQLEVLIHDPLGISTVELKTPAKTTSIVPIGNPKKFTISQNILIKNRGTYNTSHGKYDITISYKNSEDVTISKEFTFTIKRLTTDYHFSPGITTKPPVGDLWDSTYFTRILDYGTGAPLQRIEVKGSLGTRTYNAPFDNSSGVPTVEIFYSDISPNVPAGTMSLNFSIISDTGGVSTENIILVDP